MRRRPILPAVCAVVVLVVGQLLAFAHQAAERHVTCTEHGEELEAVTLVDAIHACEHDHFIAVDGDSDGDHDDCAFARALRERSAAASSWIPPQLTAVVTDAVVAAPLEVASARTLYLIAPKTSPPV